MRSPLRPLTTVALLLALLSTASFALAQPGGLEFEPPGGLGDLPGLNLGDDSEDTTVTADFQVQKGSREGRLMVTADVPKDWHIYSTTQPKESTGFPTKIRLADEEAAPLQIVGPFQADRDPHLVPVEGKPAKSEEFEGKVTWTAPIKFKEGVDPSAVKFDIKFDALVCRGGAEGACRPVFEKLAAKFTGTYEATGPDVGSYDYQDGMSHVMLRGRLEPAVAKPGDTVNLTITAVPNSGFHVYAEAEPAKEIGSRPTLITLTEASGLEAQPLEASSPPIEKKTADGKKTERYYEQPVSWTIPLKAPQDLELGEYRIDGAIAYQTCKNSCDPPAGATFSTTLKLAAQAEEGAAPLAFASSTYKTVEKLVSGESESGGFDAGLVKSNTQSVADLPFYQVLGWAFLGGLILNIMPCVFPVIGLKIMSFVQQAGENRLRSFMLNGWYSAGLISVFIVVATLAVVWNIGWGGAFGFDTFNITMASIVFVMGLSFIGVWEIPIPGFVGSGKANELASKEGPLGAFFKGALTTILATPCSGPGLATALIWCGGNRPTVLVYSVFLVMGLGMSTPYLIIGAFPELLRFIPRPGPWMETFKQAMGFLLLGTVVFILTFLEWEYIVPTVTFLFGLWMACWWIGRKPTAELPVKLRAWGVAAVIAMAVWIVGFSENLNLGFVQFPGVYGLMSHRLTAYEDKAFAARQELLATGGSVVAEETQSDRQHKLPWEAFTTEKLKRLTSQRKTVMVDFTADWCATCKVLEANVLNTEPVRKVVDENNIVPLMADYTRFPPEITNMLEVLTNSKQVPVLAIFPADKPNEPVVLVGGYTQGYLLKTLKEAGPSATVARNDVKSAQARLASTDD
jgi:suppressor for copper-sensitivity B